MCNASISHWPHVSVALTLLNLGHDTKVNSKGLDHAKLEKQLESKLNNLDNYLIDLVKCIRLRTSSK